MPTIEVDLIAVKTIVRKFVYSAIISWVWGDVIYFQKLCIKLIVSHYINLSIKALLLPSRAGSSQNGGGAGF